MELERFLNDFSWREVASFNETIFEHYKQIYNVKSDRCVSNARFGTNQDNFVGLMRLYIFQELDTKTMFNEMFEYKQMIDKEKNDKHHYETSDFKDRDEKLDEWGMRIIKLGMIRCAMSTKFLNSDEQHTGYSRKELCEFKKWSKLFDQTPHLFGYYDIFVR